MDPGPDQVPSGRKRKCYVIINDGSEEVKKVVVPYSEDATVRELQDEIMRRCDFQHAALPSTSLTMWPLAT